MATTVSTQRGPVSPLRQSLAGAVEPGVGLLFAIFCGGPSRAALSSRGFVGSTFEYPYGVATLVLRASRVEEGRT